ncbi:MAG: hypothetical protein ACRDT4_07850 [Micromonosporaceae bacterium]
MSSASFDPAEGEQRPALFDGQAEAAEPVSGVGEEFDGVSVSPRVASRVASAR